MCYFRIRKGQLLSWLGKPYMMSSLARQLGRWPKLFNHLGWPCLLSSSGLRLEFSDSTALVRSAVPLGKVVGKNVEMPLAAELWPVEGQGNVTNGSRKGEIPACG